MVRVGGLRTAIDPRAKIGGRISRMTLDGKPIDAAKTYKVAGWAPVSEEAKRAGGEPIWDVMTRYLRVAEDHRAPRRRTCRGSRARREPGDGAEAPPLLARLRRANLRFPAWTTTVRPAATIERLVGDHVAVDL